MKEALQALCIAIVLVLIYAATRPPKKLTTSEWLERMRKLGIGVK